VDVPFYQGRSGREVQTSFLDLDTNQYWNADPDLEAGKIDKN
jgi:hypothetical protein